MERWTGTPEGTRNESCGRFGKRTPFLRLRARLKTGCEGEWSAFDPLPKLTQASDKDVRIIVGKERESYEPELNYTGCEGERSGLKHWTRITQRAACSRADILGSGRQSCEPEFNYTGCDSNLTPQGVSPFQHHS